MCHAGSVAKPFADHVGRVALLHLSLAARSEILERLWPDIDASATDYLLERSTQVLGRSSGQARVRINGRDIYLGRHGSRQSRERLTMLSLIHPSYWISAQMRIK